MNLRVLDDRVFIRPDVLPDRSSSGLHLVHNGHKSAMYGVVVARGEGPLTSSGKRYEHLVRVGDRVIFSPNVGEELFFERDLIVSMRETDVLAVIVNGAKETHA